MSRIIAGLVLLLVYVAVLLQPLQLPAVAVQGLQLEQLLSPGEAVLLQLLQHACTQRQLFWLVWLQLSQLACCMSCLSSLQSSSSVG